MIYKLGKLPEFAEQEVGSKALNLQKLMENGYPVPPGIVLSTRAYRDFTEKNGIKTKLSLFLHKKSLDEMRWEELWDLALTIEHLFIQGDMPAGLLTGILEHLHQEEKNVKAVRSSSTLEDLKEASFAGLHNSLVDVQGMESILEAVQQVWASLWTDRSLMFRKELGLQTENDAMAVIIQDFIAGDFSGVIFSMHPNDPQQALIETVAGWNDKLVSGKKEPERYTIKRDSGKIVTEKKQILTTHKVKQVFNAGMSIEKLMGSPQDIEWTFKGEKLYILQTRAITTISKKTHKPSAIELYREPNKRKWALSLRPSLSELLDLQQKINNDILPRLKEDGLKLAEANLEKLKDDELEKEILSRLHLFEYYEELYWEYFIPYGHAFRLFGEIYNRYMLPDSPFTFIDLLSSDALISVERNRRIRDLTRYLQGDDTTAGFVKEKKWENLPRDFMKMIYELMEILGSASLGEDRLFKDPRELIGYLAGLSAQTESGQYRQAVDHTDAAGIRVKEYLKIMETKKEVDGELLLSLARHSYSLRDNDNMYLGKIKSEYLRSLEEKKRRTSPSVEVVAGHPEKTVNRLNYTVLSRQLIGAPAVEGIGTGKARLIENQQDLLAFKPGEIIVCNAVDPAITFIVPLASAIVEKRGGMLIHGAIIAREYGIPCVTGVQGADVLIENGFSLLVDGYLGIVTITDQRTSR